MKKNNHMVGICATVFVLMVIGVVWYLLFGYRIVPRLKLNETSKVQADKPLLDISNIDEAYDAILNKSTNNFIGSHPIDESFLGWFTGNYSVEAVENIAAYAELDNADIWYDVSGSSIHVLWYNYCAQTGLQDSIDERIVEKKCDSSYQTVLTFTGDFSLAEGVGTTSYFHSVGDDLTQCIDGTLLNEMNASDITVVNNECTYSTRGTPLVGKDYLFRADPKTAENLKVMGTDVVGLANNHVYDYGSVGLLDTLENVQKLDLPVIGAGKNIKEASEPIYFIANGKKIAIVAATQIERSTKYTKEATEDSPGVLKTLHTEKYLSAIAQAKKNADYVICFVHWGTEGTHQYGVDQYTLAKSFVEAGADAIIGGHTHCLQGVDMIQGVPVYYSLGNFYFSQESEMPSDYDTAMTQLIIESDGSIQTKLVPCHFSAGKLSLVKEQSQFQQIIGDVNSYSDHAKLDENGYLVEQ